MENGGDLQGYFEDDFYETFFKKQPIAFKNGFTIVNGSNKILKTIRDMENFTSVDSEDEIARKKFDLLTKSLFVSIWKASSTKPKEDQSYFYRKAALYIKENYHQDIMVDDVVRVTKASKSYLQQLFKEYHGFGIKKYIEKTRVNKAMEILKETNYGIDEISKIVGFNSPQVFLTNFKQNTGMTPKAYRKQALAAQRKHYFKDNGSYREKKYR